MQSIFLFDLFYYYDSKVFANNGLTNNHHFFCAFYRYNVIMENKDYYQEKLAEIRKYMKTDVFVAKQLLDEELKMPYIPLKYEQDFLDLHKENKLLIAVRISNKTFEDEEVKKYLWSNDELKEAMVLEFLKKANLRAHVSELAKWIETKPKTKNIAKSFIYELLVLQEINVELKWNGQVVNPSKNKSIFDNKEVAKGIKKIKKLTFKEPSLESSIMEEFEKGILNDYPKVLKDGAKKAEAIYDKVIKSFE